VACFAGWLLVQKLVNAQPAPPRPGVAQRPIAGAPPPASTAALDAGAPVVEAGAPRASAAADKEKKEEGGEKKEGEPEGFASTVLGPVGGVPYHLEGRFKSPFADPKFGDPAQVRVGLLLGSVREYDIQKGTFNADFFLSLTSDKPMPSLNPVLVNGKADVSEKLADRPTFKLFRFIGNFSTDVDLHDYPFDTQELAIELEDDNSGVDQLRLIPDMEHTNLDVGFNVAGWETAYLESRILNHYYPDRFDHDDLYYPRYVFRLGIRRFTTSAIFTVFVPAFVIVLISLTGLWLPREELEVRSNATVPMLAAAVLFHFALIQQLPATGYLTRADKLMLSVYLILGFHMLISWLWFVFDEKHTERIKLLGKWIGVPVTFAILAGGVLI
jgi:hypothetical protein